MEWLIPLMIFLVKLKFSRCLNRKKKSLNSFDQFYIYSKIYGNAFNSLFWYGLNSHVCDEQGFF